MWRNQRLVGAKTVARACKRLSPARHFSISTETSVLPLDTGFTAPINTGPLTCAPQFLSAVCLATNNLLVLCEPASMNLATPWHQSNGNFLLHCCLSQQQQQQQPADSISFWLWGEKKSTITTETNRPLLLGGAVYLRTGRETTIITIWTSEAKVSLSADVMEWRAAISVGFSPVSLYPSPKKKTGESRMMYYSHPCHSITSSATLFCMCCFPAITDA